MYSLCFSLVDWEGLRRRQPKSRITDWGEEEKTETRPWWSMMLYCLLCFFVCKDESRGEKKSGAEEWRWARLDHRLAPLLAESKVPMSSSLLQRWPSVKFHKQFQTIFVPFQVLSDLWGAVLFVLLHAFHVPIAVLQLCVLNNPGHFVSLLCWWKKKKKKVFHLSCC